MNGRHLALLVVTASVGLFFVATSLAAKRSLESPKIYALRYAMCNVNYVDQPSIFVDPPIMWSTYDSTGKPPQKIAWRARIFMLRTDTNPQRWDEVFTSTWESSYARNQLPRGVSDPGNLATYVMGTLIFTGAEPRNDPFQYDKQFGFNPEYKTNYRVMIDMYWYASTYSKSRHLKRFDIFKYDLSGYARDCVVS